MTTDIIDFRDMAEDFREHYPLEAAQAAPVQPKHWMLESEHCRSVLCARAAIAFMGQVQEKQVMEDSVDDALLVQLIEAFGLADAPKPETPGAKLLAAFRLLWIFFRKVPQKP